MVNKEKQIILDRMESTNDSMFITGKAGTGKTYLIQEFMKTTKKNVLLLAPTGIAAVQIGGQTIHSFFQRGINVLPENVRPVTGENAAILAAADTIIIDEVSMMRADLVDAMATSINSTVWYHSGKDFWGKQIIFVWDLYQLPPVVGNDTKKYFNRTYQSPFFFGATIFFYWDFKLPIYELQKIFRQEDEDFKTILNAVRDWTVEQHQLNTLNEQVWKLSKKDSIYISKTNKAAEEINKKNLFRLRWEKFTSKAEITWRIDKKYYANDELLTFKVWAQIMMLNNAESWQNGTIWHIKEIHKNYVLVEINWETYEVEKHERRVYTPSVKGNKLSYNMAGVFKQYPFKLAWWVTIHKSQGCTFDNVSIDLWRVNSKYKTAGLTYVALSRARTLQWISLTRAIEKSDIFIDERVKFFMADKEVL